MDQSGAPVWESMEQEVLCPLCDYNLRGLAEPRCPECGHRFDWAVVLDPAQRNHPWLFEHHPRHNLWSFFKTFAGGLRPRHFWTSVQPTQPSRPGRLGIYVAAILLLILLGWAGMVLHQMIKYWQPITPFGWPYRTPARPPGTSALPAEFWPHAREVFHFVMRTTFLRNVHILLASLLVWPIITFLALQIFGDSMHRAKLKTTHALRCVVYSFDALGWWSLMLFLSAGIAFANAAAPIRFMEYGTLLLLGAVWWRLWRAYRHYMRLRHSWVVILSSQVIAFLIWANAILYLSMGRGRIL